MRILILGNNYSSESFFQLFQENKEDIIFSTIPNSKNYIELNSLEDIIDFCEGNDINLVIVTENRYVDLNLQEILANTATNVFAPSFEANEINSSKVYAKRFMHKNKIPTSKFFVAEKPQLAVDYFNSTNILQAIKPDFKSYQENVIFCETKLQAKNVINNFFETGNKKIILEDYVEGKNVNIWTISDGYNAKIIGASAKYLNNIAEFNPYFLDKKLEEKIFNTIIQPTFSSLVEDDTEYTGILGFDIIIDYHNNPYLIGYNNFFDDLNVDFYSKGIEFDWIDIFKTTMEGNVFLKYDFAYPNKYMISCREEEKINFISAKTNSNLNKLIEEIVIDKKTINEARRIWKY